MLVYATAEDLTDGQWVADVPAGAAALLRFASALVRRATMTAVYRTDATGRPTDDAVADAFRDATCAQVAAWVASDVNPVAGAAPAMKAPVQSKKLATGAVTYDTSAAASVTALTARARAATSLGQEALLILSDAGLVGNRPAVTR